MRSKELKQEEGMSYAEQTAYLLKKYGKARYDYFLDDVSWIRSQSVSRTKEGLFCHHIDEYDIPTLSDRDTAMSHGFAHQKADRLVYCNYLEHLLLHMKIGYDRFLKNHQKLKDPSLFSEFLTHGVIMITHEVNTLIADDGSESLWQENCFDAIRKYLPDYPELLRDFQIRIILLYEKSAPWNASAEENMEALRQVLCDSDYGVLEDLLVEIRIRKECI